MEEPVALDGHHTAARLQSVEQSAEALGAIGHATGERRQPHTRHPHVAHVLLDDLFRCPFSERADVGEAGRSLEPQARRVDVKQGAAADGDDGRVGADDEAIAGQRDQRRLQTDACEGTLAGGELGVLEQQHAGHDLARADVEAHAVAVLERPRRIGEQLEQAIHQDRRNQRAGETDHVAALDRGTLQALEVDRGALTCARLGHSVTVRLKPADLRGRSPWKDLHPVVDREPAGHQRAGDHGAESLDGEDPVDGQTRQGVGRAGRNGRSQRAQHRPQLGKAGAGLGRDGHDRSPVEKRAADQPGDVLAHQLQPVGLDQIGLGEDDHARFDAQERADGQMLAGLGHHAFVSGDDEHGEVDAPDSREHVLDESLVTGDVDDLDGESVRLLEKGKAEIDGDAARLFFGQPVGVDTGQRFDERGLAVVDVARSADDDCSGCRKYGLTRGWPAQGTKQCVGFTCPYPRFPSIVRLVIQGSLLRRRRWRRRGH